LSLRETQKSWEVEGVHPTSEDTKGKLNARSQKKDEKKTPSLTKGGHREKEPGRGGTQGQGESLDHKKTKKRGKGGNNRREKPTQSVSGFKPGVFPHGFQAEPQKKEEKREDQ